MRRPILESQIAALSKETIPMHMPGHKRNLRPSPSLPYELDLTEIEGADDLHDAGGILKDAMERASLLWGSDRTWFLVGGSTCGVLAGIRAAVPFGAEIIAARNCHRSVYHAIELGGCKAHWIIPEPVRRAGICGEITAAQVRSAIRKHPESAAVVLTSPTYEGVISDIRAIADICHSAGIPLIVDEAHGAHLGLYEEGGFPDGSIRCGADLVVQSLHKTLPSMTQTALLHLQGNLIEPGEVERQLGIFETSSPSYPLMISIDSCTELLNERGPALFEAWKSRLDRFYEEARQLRCIKVWMPENAKERALRKGSRRPQKAVVRDRSKILISFQRAGLTGTAGAKLLRERYGIETEMASGANVLAMTGCGDSDDSLRILSEALADLDRNLSLPEPGEENPGSAGAAGPMGIPQVHAACDILTAVNSPWEEVPVKEAVNRICAEYLYAYPPGIPILAPGEYIRREHIARMKKSAGNGNRIHRTHSRSEETIACLAE